MNDALTSSATLVPLALGATLPEADPALVWFFGLASAAVIFNQVSSAWGRLTGRFKEREGSGPEYIKRDDCEKHHTEMHNQFTTACKDISSRLDGMRKEFKEDIEGMHSKTNRIAESVGELRGMLRKSS